MAKNTFRQYVPGFVNGVRPFKLEFNTLDELLSNEWINGWTKHAFDKSLPNPEFHRFSISVNCLMCELDEGKKWYALGYIKHPELVNLPKWEKKC